MIRVLIADDHPILRRGLAQIVAEQPDMIVAAETGDGREVLRLVDNGQFDGVILDISMLGKSGLEVLGELKPLHPELPVLVLSAHSENDFALRLLKAGASGYLHKEMAPEELVAAIRLVIAGWKYVSPAAAELLADWLGKSDDAPQTALSDREFQVMLLIAEGKTVSEIADMINLSVKTVSTYRARILEKMNLKNNAELMHCVISNKLAPEGV